MDVALILGGVLCMLLAYVLGFIRGHRLCCDDLVPEVDGVRADLEKLELANAELREALEEVVSTSNEVIDAHEEELVTARTEGYAQGLAAKERN